MDDVSKEHSLDLSHHVRQGITWLSASNCGQNTAALSYAAFEFRFAIERLALHYWTILLNRRFEESDLREIGSFKRIERGIYKLAGHQKDIDRHFEFMRIFIGALKIDIPLHTPNIGELSRLWHERSELCHIGWPLACSVDEVRKGSFSKLTETSTLLSTLVGSLGWPMLQDASLSELRNRFVADKASVKDVTNYIHQKGLWASVEYPNRKPPKFIDEPVAPNAPELR